MLFRSTCEKLNETALHSAHVVSSIAPFPQNKAIPPKDRPVTRFRCFLVVKTTVRPQAHQQKSWACSMALLPLKRRFHVAHATWSRLCTQPSNMPRRNSVLQSDTMRKQALPPISPAPVLTWRVLHTAARTPSSSGDHIFPGCPIFSGCPCKSSLHQPPHWTLKKQV